MSRWWFGIFVPSGTHGPRPRPWEPRSENTVATRQDVDELCENRVCATYILNYNSLTSFSFCTVHILYHQYLLLFSDKKREFKISQIPHSTVFNLKSGPILRLSSSNIISLFTTERTKHLPLSLRHLDVFCSCFASHRYSDVLCLQMSNSEEGLAAECDMEAHCSRRVLVPEHRYWARHAVSLQQGAFNFLGGYISFARGVTISHYTCCVDIFLSLEE